MGPRCMRIRHAGHLPRPAAAGNMRRRALLLSCDEVRGMCDEDTGQLREGTVGWYYLIHFTLFSQHNNIVHTSQKLVRYPASWLHVDLFPPLNSLQK